MEEKPGGETRNLKESSYSNALAVQVQNLLGITYKVQSKDQIVGTFKVTRKLLQPFGRLHGGITAAFAEDIGSRCSGLNVKGTDIVLGSQLVVNHISSAREGDVVVGTAKPLHLGRSTHVMNIDVKVGNRLISTARLTMLVLSSKRISSKL